MAGNTTRGREIMGAALRVGAAFAGTVVGAGFASGQEILQFFGLYGLQAGWGVGLAGALLAGYGYLILRAGARFQARSHRELLTGLATPPLAALLDGLLLLFLLGGLAAMAAGAGAVAREQLGLPAPAGSALLVAGAATAVLFGLDGVVRTIAAVVPWLLGAVLLVALGNLATHPLDPGWAPPAPAVLPAWPLAAVAYGSYNLILAVGVLGPLGRASPRQALLPGALVGAAILASGALAIHFSLFTLEPQVLQETELPMVLLATRLAPGLGPAYSLVLLAEIFTTAVANLFGLVARLDRSPFPRPAPPRGPARGAVSRWRTTTLAVSVLAWLMAQVGLAALVRNLYTLIGVAGVTLLAALSRQALGELRR